MRTWVENARIEPERHEPGCAWPRGGGCVCRFKNAPKLTVPHGLRTHRGPCPSCPPRRKIA